MKIFYLLLIIVTIASQFFCNSVDTNSNSREDRNINSTIDDSNKIFNIDLKTLTKDFDTWWNYTYHNVRLSQDFIGLDVDSTKINKETFLNKLMIGNVVAFKIKIINGQPVYRLFNLNNIDEGIKTISKQSATTEMAHFKMEGTEIPDFDFTDLNGKIYDKSSVRGKIMVLKCWFIGCVACVKEFPELNKLVNDYSGNSEILFISLAIDSKKELLKFLKTKEFKYATIPKMADYMTKKLLVTSYPTHLLVDSTGKIIKVVNRIGDLEAFLKKEVGRKTH